MVVGNPPPIAEEERHLSTHSALLAQAEPTRNSGATTVGTEYPLGTDALTALQHDPRDGVFAGPGADQIDDTLAEPAIRPGRKSGVDKRLVEGRATRC